MFPQCVHGLVIDLVRSCYSPEAGGLYRCQFFQRLDGFCWWKRTDRRILPSWARRPGTPEAAWTRPSEVGTSLWIKADDPDEQNLLQSIYSFVLFPKVPPIFTFPPSVSLSRHQHEKLLTHTSTHCELNVLRQWARPLKKIDTILFNVFFIAISTKQHILAPPIWQTQERKTFAYSFLCLPNRGG